MIDSKPTILSGGVSITSKEIQYVNDALKNGWDLNHNSYIKKFEQSFADYIGVKYARSLSGGTQALTIALATLDVGPGDEVILPDLTYFACSDVIVQLGATPVFVDVDRKTWCITGEAVEKAITSRTKAIMPVWLYGNAPQMDEIFALAQQHNLYIVEDACPAVGTFLIKSFSLDNPYSKKMAGSFGAFGCYSFHGSKIMTTGFGGMLVTDNEELYHKALWLADHGEDKSKPYRFWQTTQGYSFDLPNINCAMGLAQLERIDELVTKKRQIYSWYRDRLDIEGVSLNFEESNVHSNMWMTSVILDKDFGISRDKIIQILKARGVDTRPFFFPISDFPMYDNVDTPNAHHLGYNGINLPSGVQRTEEEIDFISTVLKEILCA